MALTPVEIRHIGFGRGILGYKRQAVDRTLTEIADSFEDVWRDRADLADKVEQLEHDLVRYRELETLLRTTLVSAERAAHELRDQAKREAALIVGEAQAEAREITRGARAELERLDAESRRIGSLLRSALDTVARPDEPVPDALPEPERVTDEADDADDAPTADDGPSEPRPRATPRPALPRPTWEGEAEAHRPDRWEAA
jgi:cell division initiation protein